MTHFTKLCLMSVAACAVSSPAFAGGYYGSGGGYYATSAKKACQKAETNRKLIGGTIGAVAGGLLGSEVAASKVKTEGAATGAILGGLLGAGIADKTVDCDPVYQPRTLPDDLQDISTDNGQDISVTLNLFDELPVHLFSSCRNTPNNDV